MSVILFVTVCLEPVNWSSNLTIRPNLPTSDRGHTSMSTWSPAAVVLHFSITPSELLAFRPALFSSSLCISSLPMIAWNIGTFWDVPVLDVTPKKHPEITLFTREIEVIKESCVCWAPPVRTVQNNSFLQSKLKLNWTVCWKPGLYSHFHIMLASQLDSQWAPRTWTLYAMNVKTLHIHHSNTVKLEH